MKTLEFQGQLKPDGTLAVPENIAEQVPAGQAIRVVIVLPEADTEEKEWTRMAAAEFLKGYAESDAVYDALPAG